MGSSTLGKRPLLKPPERSSYLNEKQTEKDASTDEKDSNAQNPVVDRSVTSDPANPIGQSTCVKTGDPTVHLEGTHVRSKPAFAPVV